MQTRRATIIMGFTMLFGGCMRSEQDLGWSCTIHPTYEINDDEYYFSIYISFGGYGSGSLHGVNFALNNGETMIPTGDVTESETRSFQTDELPRSIYVVPETVVNPYDYEFWIGGAILSNPSEDKPKYESETLINYYNGDVICDVDELCKNVNIINETGTVE